METTVAGYPYVADNNQYVGPSTKYETRTNTEVQMPQYQTVGVERKVEWSWCPVITASISVWFCTLFGFLGVLFSVLSYADHKSGDYARSAKKRRCAMGWSIAGIVIGAISFIVIVVVIVMQANSNASQRLYDIQ